MEWIGEVEIAKSLGEADLCIYYWHDSACQTLRSSTFIVPVDLEKNLWETFKGDSYPIKRP